MACGNDINESNLLTSRLNSGILPRMPVALVFKSHYNAISYGTCSIVTMSVYVLKEPVHRQLKVVLILIDSFQQFSARSLYRS